MCPIPCQIRIQVGRDNGHTCESLFFHIKKKKKEEEEEEEEDIRINSM
jgi:hypothetical protein